MMVVDFKKDHEETKKEGNFPSSAHGEFDLMPCHQVSCKAKRDSSNKVIDRETYATPLDL